MGAVNLKLQVWQILDTDPQTTAEELAEELGCKFLTARRYRNRWLRDEQLIVRSHPRLARVAHYPVYTTVGVAYGPAVQPPAYAAPGKDICDVCSEHRECCADVACGDFAHCEEVLASEVLPKEHAVAGAS